MTKLFDMALYMGSGIDHFLRVGEEDLAMLEQNLNIDRNENFAQIYCHDDESVVGIRLDNIELYTAKEADL